MKNPKNPNDVGKLPFNEEFCDSITQSSKFGTYEIQPTNDTDNLYPAIAQGLSEEEAARIKKEQELWESQRIKADDH